MILQLNPTIPVECSQFGKGWAHFLIDYSQEHDLLWGVFFDTTRIFVLVNNRDIRIQENWSLGRFEPKNAGDTLVEPNIATTWERHFGSGGGGSSYSVHPSGGSGGASHS